MEGRPLARITGKTVAAALVLGGVSLAFAIVSFSVTRSLLESRWTDSDTTSKPYSDWEVMTPIEKQIEARESYLPKITNLDERKREARKLARLYRALGTKSKQAGRWAHAEMALQQAVNLDPDAAEFRVSLAYLYAEAAKARRDPEAKLSLLRSSTRQLESAAPQLPEAKRQAALRDAGSIYTALSRELTRTGQADAARRVLADAQRLGILSTP